MALAGALALGACSSEPATQQIVTYGIDYPAYDSADLSRLSG